MPLCLQTLSKRSLLLSLSLSLPLSLSFNQFARNRRSCWYCTVNVAPWSLLRWKARKQKREGCKKQRNVLKTRLQWLVKISDHHWPKLIDKRPRFRASGGLIEFAALPAVRYKSLWKDVSWPWWNGSGGCESGRKSLLRGMRIAFFLSFFFFFCQTNTLHVLEREREREREKFLWIINQDRVQVVDRPDSLGELWS